MSAFLPKSFQDLFRRITLRIWKARFYCGKPGGKSGKLDGKLLLFFTKTVENPVEKVKSSFQTGNSIHFPVVLLHPKSCLTAVFPGRRAAGFPQRGQRCEFLECPAQSWYNINR